MFSRESRGTHSLQCAQRHSVDPAERASCQATGPKLSDKPLDLLPSTPLARFNFFGFRHPTSAKSTTKCQVELVRRLPKSAFPKGAFFLVIRPEKNGTGLAPNVQAGKAAIFTTRSR